MSRTARWLIAAGYLTPAVLVGAAWLVIISGVGDFGGRFAFAFAFMGAMALAGVLLLAGVLTALEALVRARGQFRWYDYAMLAAGVAPWVAVGIIELWPG